MRKLFLLNLAALLVVSSLFYTSCKTPTHGTLPTPVNNRLLSYTKFTTSIYGAAVNENFTFSYDSRKRVSQILYSTNDSVKTVQNIESTSAIFTYSNDTIYKTTSSIKTGLVIEMDTFITLKGQLAYIFMPYYQAVPSYFGNLISGLNVTVTGPTVAFSSASTFTSNNGDLLSRSSLGLTGFAVVGSPANIDSSFFKSFSYLRDAYTVYPDLTNRIGDYYQLESFTTYGINLYANAHMLKSVYGTGLSTGLLNITYDIDADSKVTQTYVTGYGYVTSPTTIYKLQYEQY